jgi:CAAX prenyl protease-like protein
MGTATSETNVASREKSRAARWATAIEVLAVFAGILAYIWRWQHSHPWVWVGLAAAVAASHIIHHDTWTQLGLSARELRASASVALPLFVILAVPLVTYALLKHILTPDWPGPRAALYFGGYGAWCAVQQYLAQSYFFNRLESVLESRHWSAAMVALMFGGAHIPNPVLMVVTSCAAFLFSEIFAMHRNIWPLALVQTVGGALVAALAPAWLIHNMRVGPGYFFYGIR